LRRFKDIAVFVVGIFYCLTLYNTCQ